MPAVFVNNNPKTCAHTYPMTRDGRCHGCGAQHPESTLARAPLLASLAQAIDAAAELTTCPPWERTTPAPSSVLAAFLNNKAQIIVSTIDHMQEESEAGRPVDAGARDDLRAVARALAELAATFNK